MTLFAGLDVNASRVRAVSGSTATARPLSLEAVTGEMPLALSLEGRRVEAGHAALQIARRLPHLACADFLPHLGDERQWAGGRHRLSAAQAFGHVLKALQPRLAEITTLGLSVPAYLSRAQADLLADLVKAHKLPLAGWVRTALAATTAARAQASWHGRALIVDADDHALSWTLIDAEDAQARLVAERVEPALGVRAWKERLLNCIADRCIRHSRRDPRHDGACEQLLYEQFDGALEACRHGQLAELVVQAEQWYQELVLRPGEIERYEAALVRAAVAGLRELFAAAPAERPPALVAATAPVARLPGLLRAVQDQTGLHTKLVVLGADAVAQAAHELAVQWRQGALSRGPIDAVISLKKTPRAKPAPARQPARRDDDFSVNIDE